MVTGEEPVLTADDDIFLCSLTTVIVYFDAAVLEICPHGVNVAKYMHGGATKQSLGPILHFLEIGSILGPLLQGIQQGR